MICVYSLSLGKQGINFKSKIGPSINGRTFFFSGRTFVVGFHCHLALSNSSSYFDLNPRAVLSFISEHELLNLLTTAVAPFSLDYLPILKRSSPEYL